MFVRTVVRHERVGYCLRVDQSLVTREFSMGDYEAMIALCERFEEIEIAEGDDRESVARFLRRNPGMSRVVTNGSSIIGVAMCGHDGRRGYIYHLAVDREYRGRGLGKQLVEECLAGLRETGIQRALILVAQDNLRGREFWKSGGWEELAEALAMGRDT